MRFTDAGSLFAGRAILAGDMQEVAPDRAVPHQEGGQTFVYFNDGKAAFPRRACFPCCTWDDPAFPLRRFLRCQICGTPLTGSRSTGRSRKYPYYHCRRGCAGISARSNGVEDQLVSLLEALQPKPEYLRLFRAVVLDCWKSQRDQAADIRGELERRVSALRAKLQRVEDAYVLDRAIDGRSYSDRAESSP